MSALPDHDEPWHRHRSLLIGTAIHAESAQSLAVAHLPDGRVWLVSGGGDGTVRRWDVAGLDPIGAPLRGHTDQVRSVTAATLDDGRVLAVSGGGDGTIRRWDVLTGHQVGDPLTGHEGAVSSVTAVTSPDGEVLLLSGGVDGTVRRWNAATGAAVGSPLGGHFGVVGAATGAALPDGRVLVVSGDYAGTVRRWDAVTGEPVGDPLTGHTQLIQSLATGTLADGRVLLASSGDDRIVQRWDLSTGEPVGDRVIGDTGSFTQLAVAVLPDGRALVVGGDLAGTVSRWDALTGDQVEAPATGGSRGIASIVPVTLPDGRVLLVTGSYWGTLGLWDAAGGPPLTTQAGAVEAFAVTPGPRPVLVVSRDGTLQQLDLTTGAATGDAITLRGATGPVAAATVPDGRVLLIAADRSAALHFWDAATGREVVPAAASHERPVLSLAVGTLPDGRALLVSGGGADRTVRRWDAATGTAIGRPLTGHTDWVRSVAVGTLPDGRALLVSGADDRTARRWDAETGEPIGDPLSGHTGWVLSVAVVALSDGRVLVVSGDADGVVARWDAVTGDLVGDPFTAHAGWVDALTSTALPDGRVLLLSRGDGVVRRWDAATGEPVGDPLAGHTGPITDVVTSQLPDGTPIVVTASSDATVLLRPLLGTGQVVDEGDVPAGVDAGTRTDEEGDERSFRDVLGRGVLAAHLEELLVQLTERQRAGTAVIHVDGRWGSGKSSLVTLLRQRMTRPDEAADGDGPRLRDPVVVRYDAWRESAVAPEWWSVATAVNRAVRRERTAATRLAMTVVSAATRVVRSVPLLVAAGLLAATVAARVAGVWAGDVKALGTLLTTLTAIATLGLAVGRVLFWSSPALGRLHVRSDDNPLGEIAAVVASLRRWSPRAGSAQRVGDTALAVGLVLAGAWAVAVVAGVPEVRDDLAAAGARIADRSRPLLVAAVAALVVAGAYRGAAHPVAGERRPGWPARLGRATLHAIPWRLRRRARRVAGGTGRALLALGRGLARLIGRLLAAVLPGLTGEASRRLRTVLLVAAVAVAAYAMLGADLPDAARRWPLPAAAAPLLLVLAAFAVWTAARRDRPRRPVLLVVDDIDRCAADRVVGLLETVHTLLREPPDVRILRRWRRAAPLVVLVLGDGRWIRCCFETVYEDFDGLGSDVHGLGADFLQKVFDHVVLVPALSADQVREYVGDVTELSAWATANRAGRARPAVPPPAPPPPVVPQRDEAAEPADPATPERAAAAATSPATARAERAIAGASASQVHSAEVRAQVDAAPAEDRQRLAEEVATKAASRAAITSFSEHLLAHYADVMPANPRLVKRVANTFGMLMALSLHVGHHEPEDYVARAAIVFVRFPSLVDELVAGVDPPLVDPEGAEAPSVWFRRDVQAVLRDERGKLIDITRLARCLGREYAPDIR